MFSYHAHLSPLPFFTPFKLSFACLISLYLPPLFPLRLLRCSPLFFSPRPFPFAFSSPFSQSRIPGTVIPLCAAQYERMFNTTRTPGEETGKETNMYTHIDTHCTRAHEQFASTRGKPVSDFIVNNANSRMLQRWWRGMPKVSEPSGVYVGIENCVKDCVCVCVRVCMVSRSKVSRVIRLLYSSSCRLSSISSCLLVSSQVCLGFPRKGLSLTNVYFLLPTHFIFSPLVLGSLSVSYQHLSVFFFLSSLLYLLSFSPLLFLVLAHLSFSCSVVVEVCSSLLFLSVWTDVWHLSNPWNADR